ncbi:hypothetical protein M3T53_05780 [Actinomyces sp. B33]|uniref:hypothetical protein n=1 Tax=Actinomyces sp. B33 TaxID=2942131 RepID=UPI002340200C|nr:hypothetical protein [Actinomyces sp. B33]MDC4233219.1 hypothetical protein [Actinomyces sp. B33]
MTPIGIAVSVAGALLSIGLGWLVTLLVLRIAKVVDSAPDTVGAADGRARLLRGPTASSHVLRGGTWIGILERLAVYTAILSGQPMLISAVIAVKGLGRYPELRENPAAAERFLIGTGASILTAVLVAIGAAGALDALA